MSFVTTAPRKALTIMAVAAVVGVGACTTDPFTGEQQVSNTAGGAVIGAAVGGLAGAVIGNNTGDGDARRGALIGAGIGALTGGAVGVYMDRQEAALRQRLQNTGVSVTRSGDQLILNMPSAITFATGSADLQPQFTSVLDSVALVFQEFDRSLVDVDGHTDSDGSEEFNLDLSQRRAMAVANYIASRGVDGRRFLVNGFGESQPIASNDTPDGKARNRRVEIRIVPLT